MLLWMCMVLVDDSLAPFAAVFVRAPYCNQHTTGISEAQPQGVARWHIHDFTGIPYCKQRDCAIVAPPLITLDHSPLRVECWP